MTTSIVIPNFNGENLLKKNLPNILKSGADEVIILDDCSSDESLDVLKKLQITNYKLQIINRAENKGFIPSVNELFNEASGDIVVLLNNDVYVEPNFLESLLRHFQNEQVFAVNLHERGSGPSVAFWKDGFYEFKKGEEKAEVQKSAWASGGSAAFRKNVWQNLGGFDEIFAPFYWEDVDLSFRALKMGYEILWEPEAIVRHDHETTIKKSFGKKYIDWVQQRNQLIFIWKNIYDPKLGSEHRKNLVKRLLTSGLGYWIPYLWAISKKNKIASSKTPRSDDNAIGDREAINYAA